MVSRLQASSPVIFGLSVAALGDFRRHETDDILWKNNSTGQVYAWLMDDGQPMVSFGIAQMDGKTVLGAGDFNNDGNSDFLWRDPANGVLHILSMGSVPGACA